MADIKYLAGLDIDGNINLNTGQLQFAVIQPDTSDPTAQTPQVGQIYYKSDSQSLRIYSGATDGWVTVGQDSNNYVTGGSISGGTLTLTREGLADVTIAGLLQIGTTSTTALAGNTTLLQLGTTSTTALAGDTTTISSAQATAITTNTAKVTFPGFGTTAGTALEGNTSLFDGDYNSLSNLPTLGTAAAAAATDFVAVTGDTMSGDLNIAHNNGKIVLGNTNSGNTNNRIEGIGISGKTFVQFGYNENDGGDEYLRLKLGFNGGSTNDYNFLSASIEEENDPNNGVKSGHISIGTSGLDDIYLTANDTNVSGRLQVSGTGQSSFAGQVTIPTTPAAATDAASKAYVDDKVTGQLVFQGGYDATAEPPTGASILKGFTYAVTVAGDGNGFFTIPLEIGDLIIAESDNPTDEGDWTEVNKNVDLATTTTVGVASFSDTNFDVSATGAVTVKDDGITLGTETTGNYVASVSGGTNVTVSGGTGEGSTPSISVANSSIDGRITNRQYSGLIGDGSLTDVPVTAATHGLGADSTEFMIQLIEVSSGETVFAEVTRGASGLVTVGFTTAPASNSIRILIQKIG